MELRGVGGRLSSGEAGEPGEPDGGNINGSGLIVAFTESTRVTEQNKHCGDRHLGYHPTSPSNYLERTDLRHL